MTFISYAQNYEDVMLRRAFKDVDKGFYIDVGANDPVIDSVTKTFYDAGWRGINIEPVSEWFEKLQRDRPEDINLQLAMGAQKSDINFYEVPGTGLSTSNKLIAKQHAEEHGFELKREKVQVDRLTAICEQYAHSDIHFLKIDVEGAETSVLQGFDLKKFRPWVILIESTLPGTQIEKYESWEPLLLAEGYEYVKFDGLNRIYVANEHKIIRNCLIPPPNVFDGFILSGTGSSSFHVGVAEIRASLQEVKEQRQQLEEQVETLRTDAEQYDDRLREKEILLQETVIKLTDNKQEFDKLAERTDHQQAIETNLQETKQQCQQLEIQVQTLRTDAERYDDRLREKETKQQELLLSMIEKETRLQETIITLTDNKQELDKLQASLAERTDHQQAIETNLQETKQQCQQLETQVQTLRMDAEQYDDRLREKESKQQELLLSMIEKETRLQETVITLTSNKQEIDKLRASLVESADQQQAIETNLQETKQQCQQLETQVQTLRAEANQYCEQVREKGESINWLNNEWEASKHQVDELQQSNHRWWSMADQQSKELEEANAKIEELNHSTHNLRTVVDNTRCELQTVYKSKSWRITWPLRKLMQFFKWLFLVPVSLIFWLFRLPKRVIRWFAVKAIAFGLKRPGLKAWAINYLRNYPNFDEKLRLLAQARGFIVAPAASAAQHIPDFAESRPAPSQPTIELPKPEEVVIKSKDKGTALSSDLSLLTPGARRIYIELKAAMKQHEKEGH